MISVPENCPLCPANGKVQIIAETHVAYLVAALTAAVDGCHLIVPKRHVSDITDLLVTWHSSVRFLLPLVPWYAKSVPYNLSFNSGEAAGQTLPHIHNWVIPRENDPTKKAYGKGLATLIHEVG